MTELEEKLQSRLDKAIEVFKQKEAEIESLKDKLEVSNAALDVASERIQELLKENNELKEKLQLTNKELNNALTITEMEQKIQRKEYDVPVNNTDENPNVMPSNFRLQDFGTTFSM